jgi:Protein of unknown function (DUF5674)
MNLNQSMIITKPIKLDSMIGLVYTYETMVKGVVDINLKKLALGGEFHADAEELLCANGSKSIDIWGFNIEFGTQDIIYTSMLNIKPSLGYKTNLLIDETIIAQMKEVIDQYIS